jgi:heme-degrading monooxygenase HmoA
MNTTEQDGAQKIVRVDRFVVPDAARAEFLERVAQTHKLLRRQTGFIRDLLLESPTDTDATSIVTVAEWESQAVVDRVIPIVQAAHREAGFDPKATMARLGVKAEIGFYKPIREFAAVSS